MTTNTRSCVIYFIYIDDLYRDLSDVGSAYIMRKLEGVATTQASGQPWPCATTFIAGYITKTSIPKPFRKSDVNYQRGRQSAAAASFTRGRE